MIGFPKGAGGKLAAYARETEVSALGLDETVDPVWAAKELPRASCAGQSRPPCTDRWWRDVALPRWSASLTHSPSALTSSISGTASCRTRRSLMSSSCLRW